jgi:6-phosphogluconolactonase
MMMTAAAPSIQWHLQPSSTALARTFSARMQQLGEEAIKTRGMASFGLAGGSTPLAAYADFAASGMPWEKVNLALIDERFVPLSDSQSNEANIGKAFSAVKNRLHRWQGLYHEAESIEACADRSGMAMNDFILPFDITVIGMGTDGHFASLFLESPDYEAAMQSDNPQVIVPIRFPGNKANIDRLSMSFPALLKTRHALICITGEAKRDVLQRCLDGSAPHYALARFLSAYEGPVDIYWSPA